MNQPSVRGLIGRIRYRRVYKISEYCGYGNNIGEMSKTGYSNAAGWRKVVVAAEL